MGYQTPFIGLFIPAAGETGYDQAFAAGMINLDQHDHSGGPNKGVPITASGLANNSVTYQKLSSNVADISTGIGTEGPPFQNRLTLLGIIKNLYTLAVGGATGFISMNGHVVIGRTFTVGAGLSISNADGIAGNPLLQITTVFVTSVIGTANQIAVTNPAPGQFQVGFAPITQNPTQPCFMASIGASQDNVTGDGTPYQVLFPTVTVNQGGYYNGGTSVFTAPVTGNYLLGLNLYIGDITSGGATNNITEIDFYVNGSLARTAFYGSSRAINAAGSSHVELSATEFMFLTAGQQVSVVLIITSTPATGKLIDIDDAYFSGVLLW